MYYRLSDDFALRGWLGLTCVLVSNTKNVFLPLGQNEFQALLLCDGETDIDEIELTDDISAILIKYKEKGIIRCSEKVYPISEKQSYQYYDNRFVQSAFWSVTGRCNYKCRHCFMDAPDAKYGELSTKEAHELIDQMAECGIQRIDITGGEPFVRKDFWELVDHLIGCDIVIDTVYTNGWLLNEQQLEEFQKRKLRPEFSISLDGIGWHDWMRRVNGAEEAALHAFELCQKYGFPTDVEMCLHRGNVDSIKETIDKLKSLGCYQFKIVNIDRTPLWKANSEGMALSNEEFAEIAINFIPEYFKEKRTEDILFASVVNIYTEKVQGKLVQRYSIVPEKFGGNSDTMNCYLCGSARASCYISPDGTLLPCMPMTANDDLSMFPKVQKIGLQQGLSDSYFMQYVNSRVKDLFEKNAECAACAYRLKCGGGCRADAFIAGERSLWGSDRSQCMLWKKGYVDKIRKAAEDAIEQYGNQLS